MGVKDVLILYARACSSLAPSWPEVTHLLSRQVLLYTAMAREEAIKHRSSRAWNSIEEGDTISTEAVICRER